MDSEPLDFDTIATERRAAAAASMEPISHDALKELGAKLFPLVEHPWQPVYEQFLAEHKDSPAVHGTVSPGVEYVFFPRERKGLWFRTSGGVQGMGPILERGLNALSEIATDKNLG